MKEDMFCLFEIKVVELNFWGEQGILLFHFFF